MSVRESKEAPASPAAAAAAAAEDSTMESVNDGDAETGAATAAAASSSSATSATAAAAAAAAPTTGGKGKAGKGSKRKAADDAPVEVDPNYEGQRFKLGELIYANYAEGKQWFEAKVLKIEKRAGLIYYFLHYQGWTDKYHDWRPYHHDNELHKHDEEGKRLMDEAKLRMKEAKKAGGKGGAAAAAASEDAANKSGKKSTKKNNSTLEDDTVGDEVSVGGAAGEVRLKIPGYLKKQLINDWEQITRGHKLVTLPRPQSVKELLAEFEASKQRQESTSQMVKEVVSGIEQYFEKAIGTVLLYRFERPQFKAQQEALGDKTLSSIYGAEHLLRLFVKLPSLLAYTKLEPKEAIVLGSKVNDLIKWLDKKAQGGTLFQQDYEAQEKEYVQSVQMEEDI